MLPPPNRQYLIFSGQVKPKGSHNPGCVLPGSMLVRSPAPWLLGFLAVGRSRRGRVQVAERGGGRGRCRHDPASHRPPLQHELGWVALGLVPVWD
jgi:hypothetical protein